MSVYELYAYVGVVCAFIIGIILNRTRATSFKNTVDKPFCGVLVFFIIFTFFDAVWGFIGFTWAVHPEAGGDIAYRVSSYLFHMLSAISSFLCCFYGTHYLNLQGKSKKIIRIASLALLAVQFAFLIQNIWTDLFFTVDANGVYKSGVLRPFSFLLQFLQYAPIMIYSFIKGLISLKKKKAVFKYFSASAFLLIPIVFGILQMLYPDGSFYSLGFAVFSVAVYSINVTRQREKFLVDYHTVEEHKKSHAEIAKALAAAEEANSSKTKFLANMSHDIRTPINGIMGVTSLLKEEEMSPKAKEYVQKIESVSSHLLSLVNDVLDMSLIENKQNAIINLEKIDIRQVCDNCESIISGQLVNRNIYFNVDYSSKLNHPFIEGDPLKLKQIFVNILGNSVKFTPDGGQISFEIFELSFTEQYVTYQFVLSDNGIGMKKEFIEHIFEPFAQENNGSRTKYQGTGLGMSITKQLVDLMHGSIQVSSELNKGTTFTIILAFKICERMIDDQNEMKKVSSTSETIDGVRILLVEDNELNMEVAKTILENNKAIITCAENGQIAADIFKESPEGSFDVILMDVMMPVLNGYQATKLIRSFDRPDAKNIPIIAMTANAFDEDKKQAILAGMNSHVAKPIDFKLLALEINNQLKKSRGK